MDPRHRDCGATRPFGGFVPLAVLNSGPMHRRGDRTGGNDAPSAQPDSAFPTNFTPIVGQQIKLTADSSAAVAARVDLLRRRADAGDCDRFAKTTVAGAEAGLLYAGNGRFRTERRAAPPIGDGALRLLARFRPVTFTCVPHGSGEQIGVDRDGDGAWDGDERDAHTDPADPNSTP